MTCLRELIRVTRKVPLPPTGVAVSFSLQVWQWHVMGFLMLYWTLQVASFSLQPAGQTPLKAQRSNKSLHRRNRSKDAQRSQRHCDKQLPVRPRKNTFGAKQCSCCQVLPCDVGGRFWRRFDKLALDTFEVFLAGRVDKEANEAHFEFSAQTS